MIIKWNPNNWQEQILKCFITFQQKENFITFQQCNSNYPYQYIGKLYFVQCLFNKKNAETGLTRFIKILQVLGKDANGNPVEEK